MECEDQDVVRDLSVSAAEDFLAQPVGQATSAQRIRARNTGTTDIDIGNVALQGDHPGDFEIVANNVTYARLASGESCALTVRFRPTATGVRRAILQVPWDGGAARTVALTGTGFAITNLTVPAFIAAGAETPAVTFDVDDPAGVVTAAQFEVYRTRDDVRLQQTELGDYSHGTKRVDYGGAIARHNDFPDDYVTIQHSPYRVKIVAQAAGRGGGVEASDEAEFKVEVDTLELTLGPEDVLKVDTSHRAVRNAMAAVNPPLPGPQQTKKILLPSDLFFTTLGEDAHDNDASFTQYRDKWGAGPLVPIYAEAKIKNSQAGSMLAPRALGTARLLWDYEDVSRGGAGLHPRAKRFVDLAADFESTTTQPPGRTAHAHFGGKRGGGAPLVPASNGHGNDVENFPFTVTRAQTRTWASYSVFERQGGSAGKSGVIFQPSRLAGDAYKLTAHIDLDGSLDKLGRLDGTQSVSTGTLEIWREVHVAKIIRKDTDVEAFDFAQLRPLYAKTFVDLVDKSGGVSEMDETDYNQKVETKLQASPSVLRDHGIAAVDAQYAAGHSCLTFRPYAQFKTTYVNGVMPELAALKERYRQGFAQVDNQTAAARADTKVRDIAHAELVMAGFSDTDAIVGKRKYADQCEDYAGTVAIHVTNEMLSALNVEGVVVFMFAHAASNTPDAGSRTNGVTPNGSNATRTRGCFVQYKPKAAYEAPQTIESTLAHEIGHCLFLPHTKHEEVGKDPDAHDTDEDGCLMGYNFKVERNFCGYCSLRLRGWDHTKLRPAAADNGRRPALETTARPGRFVRQGNATGVNETSDPQTLTVKNGGDGELVIEDVQLAGTDAAMYAITQNGLQQGPMAANATNDLQVTLTPTSLGDKQAYVEIRSNAPGSPHTVMLESGGLAGAVTLNPTQKDFELTALPAEQSVQLQNTGLGPLRINRLEVAGADAADFVLSDDPSGSTLAAQEIKTFKITFNPAAVGAKEAQVEIWTSAADAPRTMTVKGRRLGKLEVEVPDGTSFGTLQLNTLSGGKRAVLRNTGNEPVQITGIDCEHYTLENPVAGRLAVGAGHTVTVKLRPTMVGFIFSGFYVRCDAKELGTQRYFSATGDGQQGTLTINPQQKAFGTAPLPAEQEFVLHNNGPGKVRVESISFAAAGFFHDAGGAPFEIDANTDHTLTVKFLPKDAAVVATTMDIRSNATNSPLQVQVSGERQAPALTIGAPASADFGDVQEGQASPAKQFSLQNTSNVALRVTALGASSRDYTASGVALPYSLRPGETKAFDVQCTPQGRGLLYNYITVTTEPAVTPNTVWLSGNGTGPPCKISYVGPQFPARTVVGAQTTVDMRIQNEGPGAMDITAIAVDGTNAADYTNLTVTAFPLTLQANTSHPLRIQFTPSAAGYRSAVVRVTSSKTEGDAYCMLFAEAVDP